MMIVSGLFDQEDIYGGPALFDQEDIYGGPAP